MAAGFSKAIIMGNLTRDPIVRTTSGGMNVTSFGVAVNRVRKDASGNNIEQVSFFDCSAWNKLGETIANYAKKGSGVLVCGRLEQRSWDDKNTGQKRYAVEIVVDDFKFLPKAASLQNVPEAPVSTSAPADASAGANASAAEVVPEDIPDEVDLNEIPF